MKTLELVLAIYGAICLLAFVVIAVATIVATLRRRRSSAASSQPRSEGGAMKITATAERLNAANNGHVVPIHRRRRAHP